MNIERVKKYEPIEGKWRVTKELGSGAFGTVFEIERIDFPDVKAALKVITIPQSKAELDSFRQENFDMDEKSITSYYYGYVENFQNEIKMMLPLAGNSNIASYMNDEIIPHEGDVGWDILIRMELLTPINNYYKEHPPTEKDIIKLGIDICRALEVCGKYNIIHRDIKPSNIFISDVGDYKLGDFGVARTMEKTTGVLSKKGTVTYMSPEVYKGESYDATVDIYSLGIVLYRLMNNNLEPFRTDRTFADAENANFKRMNGDKIPAPANASEELSRIILKACAYNAADRFKTPTEMRKALEAIAATKKNSNRIQNNIQQTNSIEATVGIFEASPQTEKNAATVGLFESGEQTNKHEETVGIFAEVKEETANKDKQTNSAAQPKEIISAPKGNNNGEKKEEKRKKQLNNRKIIPFVAGAGVIVLSLIIVFAILLKSSTQNTANKEVGNTQQNATELTYDPYTYDYDAQYYQDGLSCVYKIVGGEYKYGLVDENKKVVIPCIYDDPNMKSFVVNDIVYIIVKKDEKYGVIDKENNDVVDIEYKSIYVDDNYITCYVDNINQISTRRENISEIDSMKKELDENKIKLYNSSSEYSLIVPSDLTDDCSYSRGMFSCFSATTSTGDEYGANCILSFNVHRGYEGDKDYSLYLAKTYEEFYDYFIGDEIAEGVKVEKVDFTYSDSNNYETDMGIYKVANEKQNITEYHLYKTIANKNNSDDIASLHIFMLEDYYSRDKMDKIANSFEVKAK